MEDFVAVVGNSVAQIPGSEGESCPENNDACRKRVVDVVVVASSNWFLLKAQA